MVNKEFLAIEFKRTPDARSNYVERATAVAQEQYKSLLTGLQAVGQVKEWKVQQIKFIDPMNRTYGVELPEYQNTENPKYQKSKVPKHVNEALYIRD